MKDKCIVPVVNRPLISSPTVTCYTDTICNIPIGLYSITNPSGCAFTYEV